MSKKNQSAQTASEQPKSSVSSEVSETESSAMAREVKIGVTVIALLLTTFAVVLFNRLNGSSDESGAAHAGTRPEAFASAPRQEDGPALARSSARSSDATVIEAKPGLAAAANNPPEQGLSPWNAGPHEGDSADHDNSGSQLPALSYMPKEPSLSAADRQAAYTVEDSATEETMAAAWQSGATAEDPTAAVDLSEADGAPNTGARVGDHPAADLTAVTPAPSAAAESEGAATEPAQLPFEGTVQPGGVPVSISGNAPVPTQTAPGQPWRAPSPPAQEAVVVQGPEPGSRQASTPPAGRPYSTFKAPEPAGISAAPSVYGGDNPAGTMAATGRIQAGQFSTPGLSADGKYVIQPNDNYWSISEKVYGTGAFFQALADHNRDVQPDETRLRLGETISVPPIEELEKLYPDCCPRPEHRKVAERHKSVMHTAGHRAGGRTYVVQEGDNLFDIARHELGKASRYGQIIQLNREVLGGQYDYLTPGMRLVLPDDSYGPPNQVTSRPDDVYQR
jgi:nucleoid-associated protein YgaU